METTNSPAVEAPVNSKKLKTTSMKLSPDTLAKLKELVASMNFGTNDELLQFMIAQITFASCSDRIPKRSQAVAEVQDLFKRVLVKFTENFDMVSDVAQAYENSIADMRNEHKAEIQSLHDKIQALEQENNTLKEVIDRFGSERNKQ